MSASQSQIDANRANAQFCTGPKTDAGKARSAQNATKDGFYSASPCVAPEDEKQYIEIAIQTAEALRPKGPLEFTLYREILTATWNLHRIQLLRLSLFTETGHDPLNCPDPDTQKRYDRLTRAHSHNSRTLHRSLRLLRELQSTRAAHSLPSINFPAGAPPLTKPSLLTKRIQFPHSQRNSTADNAFTESYLRSQLHFNRHYQTPPDPNFTENAA